MYIWEEFVQCNPCRDKGRRIRGAWVKFLEKIIYVFSLTFWTSLFNADCVCSSARERDGHREEEGKRKQERRERKEENRYGKWEAVSLLGSNRYRQDRCCASPSSWQVQVGERACISGQSNSVLITCSIHFASLSMIWISIRVTKKKWSRLPCRRPVRSPPLEDSPLPRRISAWTLLSLNSYHLHYVDAYICLYKALWTSRK